MFSEGGVNSISFLFQRGFVRIQCSPESLDFHLHILGYHIPILPFRLIYHGQHSNQRQIMLQIFQFLLIGPSASHLFGNVPVA